MRLAGRAGCGELAGEFVALPADAQDHRGGRVALDGDGLTAALTGLPGAGVVRGVGRAGLKAGALVDLEAQVAEDDGEVTAGVAGDRFIAGVLEADDVLAGAHEVAYVEGELVGLRAVVFAIDWISGRGRRRGATGPGGGTR